MTPNMRFFACLVLATLAHQASSAALIPDLQDALSTTHLKRTPHYTPLKDASPPLAITERALHGSTTIRPTNSRRQYVAEVSFNGVARSLLIDTGSADTWMVDPDFQCLDDKGNPTPQTKCNFATPFIGDFKPAPRKNYHQVYGNGASTDGRFGAAAVSIAGVTLPRQQVALVDRVYWAGDNVGSGLLGLARRTITNEYPGGYNYSQRRTYPPVSESMGRATAPLFSLALQRGRNAGYLAFGGLPPVDFEPGFASTPFHGVLYGDKRPRDRYYPIKPDGYELQGEMHASGYTTIVDSGTYINYFPKAMADKINAAFDPPAKFRKSVGFYVTTCNATVPDFGITIGGKTFKISEPEMFFFKVGRYCGTSISTNFLQDPSYPEGFYILGDAFLKNVVAVFDAGKEMMHFARHTY